MKLTLILIRTAVSAKPDTGAAPIETLSLNESIAGYRKAIVSGPVIGKLTGTFVVNPDNIRE